MSKLSSSVVSASFFSSVARRLRRSALFSPLPGISVVEKVSRPGQFFSSISEKIYSGALSEGIGDREGKFIINIIFIFLLF